MHRGLAAFGDDAELDFAVHHAGVALEHLLKACLVSLNASLIVDARDFDSLLHATGHGQYARTPSAHVRTIGLVEAFKRSKIVLKASLSVDEKRFSALAEARNGVAHMGVYDRSEAERILSTCLQVADVLLDNLGVEPDSYWGEFSAVHDQLITVDADRTRARYEAKLTNALNTFNERFQGLEGPSWEAIRTVVAASVVHELDPVHATCPACRETGWLDGERAVKDDYIYLGNDEYEGGAWVVMTPDVFRCPFCRLELRDVGLKLAGFAREIETGDNPSDFVDTDYIDDYDSDDYHDREP
jgi:hypothetical protein